MTTVEHVIIGSGINALVAAALLSRKGDSVLVLEKEDTLGGCMKTDEITLPGFHHDIMATTFVLFLTSPAFAELGEALGKHGLEFCHSDKPTGVMRPNGSALVMGMDHAANVAEFNTRAKGDGDAHSGVVGGIGGDADFLFSILGGQLWSWQMAKLMFGQWRKKGLKGLKSWFGKALEPARGWLENDFKSADVQALFAPWPLHTGLTPESAYSGQMGKVIAFALEAAGAPIVKGGSAQAVAAFKSLIEAQGGTFQTNAEVQKIDVVNRAAKGVILADGTRIVAKNILASVAPGQLYGRLLKGHLPDEEKAAQGYRQGRGNFQLHYALDGLPKWTADGLENVALVHLADGVDSVSKSANEAERGLLPAEPTICVGQPSQLDPSRCPNGKSILWLQIPDAPVVVKGDASHEIETDGTWSESTREAFADRLEGQLRRHISNFDEIKLDRKAYSPADLEALNVNLVGGDPYGGACSIDQFFLWRPFVGSVNATTSIRNLHHIGASTHPGPGLGGGSGFNVAKALGA